MRRFLAAIALAVALAAPAAAQTGFGTPNFNTLSLNGVTATGFGTGVNQIPIVGSFGGLPGWHTTDRFILQRTTPAANDFTDFQINRVTTYASTPLANIASAIHVLGVYGANDGASNWNAVFEGRTNGTAGGQTLGSYSIGSRLAGATDAVWGSISNGDDQTGLASSSGGAVLGMELDIQVNRADDGTNAASFGNTGIRKGINIAAVRRNVADTTQTEISSGIWFSTVTFTGTRDTHTNFNQAIGFARTTQAYTALDTRGLVAPTGSSNAVSAVTMDAGHVIDFNGPASFTAAPRNYLSYDGTNLKYSVSGNDFFYISNNGRIGVQAAPESQVAFAIGGTGMVLGIDVSAATLSSNAIRLAAGQTIAMDASGVHTLFYDTGSGKLFYAVSGVNKFSIDASGNVRAAGTLTPSVTP